MRKWLVVEIFILNFVFGLYLFWPLKIVDVKSFAIFPGAIRSKLSGDTVQMPNLVGLFSNRYRNFVTNFYKLEFQRLNFMPFPPMVINHPPEDAFAFIKDQTHSTYLEEYLYPFRGSLFVNGLEPFDEVTKTPRYSAASFFGQDLVNYETKVVIRYYPIVWWKRLMVMLMSNCVAIVVFKSWQNTKKLLS
jgi:hypothetical protein